MWKDAGRVDAKRFAVDADHGYDAELAQHFRSRDTQALENEFMSSVQQRFGRGESLTDEERFVGGVLASRSDSSVEVSDVISFEGINTQLAGQGSSANVVEEATQETFESLDEYMAGQAAANIETIEVTDSMSSSQVDNPVGLYNESSKKIKVLNGRRPDAMKKTTAHEIGHAVERQYGLSKTGNNDVDGNPAQWSFTSVGKMRFGPDGSAMNAPSAEAFREGVADIGNAIKEVELGGESDLVDSKIRSYQATNSREVFAVGFGNYTEDFVGLANQQPGTAELIDTHVTGGGWEAKNPSDVVTSNGERHPTDNMKHVPFGESESSLGEVTRVKFSEDADVYEQRAGEEFVGYATGYEDGALTVSADGMKRRIPEGEIETVETRTWD